MQIGTPGSAYGTGMSIRRPVLGQGMPSGYAGGSTMPGAPLLRRLPPRGAAATPHAVLMNELQRRMTALGTRKAQAAMGASPLGPAAPSPSAPVQRLPGLGSHDVGNLLARARLAQRARIGV